MDLTPIAATVPAPVAPAPQPVQTNSVKQQKLVEAQSAAKQSFVYFSPVIRIDRATSTAIFQYRDRDSGEVTREVPSESELQAYLSKGSPKTERPVAESSADAVPAVTRDDAGPEAEVDVETDAAVVEVKHFEEDA